MSSVQDEAWEGNWNSIVFFFHEWKETNLQLRLYKAPSTDSPMFSTQKKIGFFRKTGGRNTAFSMGGVTPGWNHIQLIQESEALGLDFASEKVPNRPRMAWRV